MPQQRGLGFFRQPAELLAEFFSELVQEKPGQGDDVLLAVRQGRQPDAQ